MVLSVFHPGKLEIMTDHQTVTSIRIRGYFDTKKREKVGTTS